jgi:hypothetical protein
MDADQAKWSAIQALYKLYSVSHVTSVLVHCAQAHDTEQR